MAFNPPVPEGDTVAEHYCADCGQQWAWCYCPTEDEECGASRFGDCPLPFGHAGICVERDDEAAQDAHEAGVTAENPEGSHVDRRTGLLWGERGPA